MFLADHQTALIIYLAYLFIIGIMRQNNYIPRDADIWDRNLWLPSLIASLGTYRFLVANLGFGIFINLAFFLGIFVVVLFSGKLMIQFVNKYLKKEN